MRQSRALAAPLSPAKTPTVLLLMLAFMGANSVGVVFLTWMPTFIHEKWPTAVVLQRQLWARFLVNQAVYVRLLLWQQRPRPTAAPKAVRGQRTSGNMNTISTEQTASSETTTGSQQADVIHCRAVIIVVIVVRRYRLLMLRVWQIINCLQAKESIKNS